MGSPASCSAILLLVAAAAATLQPQQQPLLAGYAKNIQPFADYNLPFAPRAPLWRRAAEIQRTDDVPDVQQPHYEHSMLQIDHPGPISQEQLSSTDDMPDVQQPHYEHSMLLIDYPPQQQQQQQQEQQTQEQQDSASGASDEPLPADGPAPADNQQRDVRLAEQDAAPPAGPGQEAQQNPAAQQLGGGIAPQEPGQYAQWDRRPVQLPAVMPFQRPRPFGLPVQPEGPVFRSSEPYPVLSPPPAYSPPGASPWGVRPMPISAYPGFIRQQEGRPGADDVGARPFASPDQYQWGVIGRGEPAPVGFQRQIDGRLDNFGMRPYAVDRMGPSMYPPNGGVPPPIPYMPDEPVERTGVNNAALDDRDQPQTAEKERNNDQESDYRKYDDDSDEEDVKHAVDVEEEVVPALVVFLRKKGHKKLHDKDSVGIPGKEDRFRRSPGGGSGSQSSASSSSSSSSGPVYFGDGSGSYSSSHSSASSSSSSGDGAPLGFGASGPGLGGSGSFYNGAQVPPSGFGATGYGGAGDSGYGGYGGYGPGFGGGSGVYGCATCGGGGGGDDNVLLNRFGAADDTAGPFTVGGSGISMGKGVHASSSSSIDSTGKVTYSAYAGKH